MSVFGRKRHEARQTGRDRQMQDRIEAHDDRLVLKAMADQAHALRGWGAHLVPFAEELEAQISDILDIDYAEWRRDNGHLWPNNDGAPLDIHGGDKDGGE